MSKRVVLQEVGKVKQNCNITEEINNHLQKIGRN